MNKPAAVILLCVVLLFKIALLGLSLASSPEAKLRIDSGDYLECARTLFREGVFARGRDEAGKLRMEVFRLPGYPLVLGALKERDRLSLDGIILLQFLVTIMSAWILYAAVLMIDRRIAFLSACMLLFDPASTVYSLMILSEAWFVFLLLIWFFFMLRYLREQNVLFLLLACLFLAGATYVRAISYYLGIVCAGFILYNGFQRNIRKAGLHCLFFIAVFYGLTGLWQFRNYRLQAGWIFSASQSVALEQGLYKSYGRQEEGPQPQRSPALYYAKTTSRAFFSLLTRPVSLKYFGFENIKKIGKVISYLWIAFWFLGWLVGIAKIPKKPAVYLILVVTAYFIGVSIMGATVHEGSRFRVPIMPFIVCLASYGWLCLFRKGEI